MGLWSSRRDVRLSASGCKVAGEIMGKKLRCKLSEVTLHRAVTLDHSVCGSQEFLTVETPELTCECQFV
jgi:hypothetical protein